MGHQYDYGFACIALLSDTHSFLLQLDCPSLPFPCNAPESKCFHTSGGEMLHSAAQTYCASQKMADIDFVDMASMMAIPNVQPLMGKKKQCVILFVHVL